MHQSGVAGRSSPSRQRANSGDQRQQQPLQPARRSLCVGEHTRRPPVRGRPRRRRAALARRRARRRRERTSASRTAADDLVAGQRGRAMTAKRLERLRLARADAAGQADDPRPTTPPRRLVGRPASASARLARRALRQPRAPVSGSALPPRLAPLRLRLGSASASRLRPRRPAPARLGGLRLRRGLGSAAPSRAASASGSAPPRPSVGRLGVGEHLVRQAQLRHRLARRRRSSCRPSRSA